MLDESANKTLRMAFGAKIGVKFGLVRAIVMQMFGNGALLMYTWVSAKWLFAIPFFMSLLVACAHPNSDSGSRPLAGVPVLTGHQQDVSIKLLSKGKVPVAYEAFFSGVKLFIASAATNGTPEQFRRYGHPFNVVLINKTKDVVHFGPENIQSVRSRSGDWGSIVSGADYQSYEETRSYASGALKVLTVAGVVAAAVAGGRTASGKQNSYTSGHYASEPYAKAAVGNALAGAYAVSSEASGYARAMEGIDLDRWLTSTAVPPGGVTNGVFLVPYVHDPISGQSLASINVSIGEEDVTFFFR